MDNSGLSNRFCLKVFSLVQSLVDIKTKKQKNNKIKVTNENKTNFLNHCLNHILSSLYLILDGVG